MRQIAAHVESKAMLELQLKAAVAYPIAMAATAVLTVCLAVYLSQFFAENIFYVVGLLALSAFGFWALSKAMKGRESWDECLLTLLYTAHYSRK